MQSTLFLPVIRDNFLSFAALVHDCNQSLRFRKPSRAYSVGMFVLLK